MYLIWRMDTTTKGAKKNTSQNEIHLQYFFMNFPKITLLILKIQTAFICFVFAGTFISKFC